MPTIKQWLSIMISNYQPEAKKTAFLNYPVVLKMTNVKNGLSLGFLIVSYNYNHYQVKQRGKMTWH